MFALFSKRKRVPHSDVPGLVEYGMGVMVHPSAAQVAVFEPTQTLPSQLFRGAGRVAGTMSKFQPPQVYVHPGHPVAGIGGLQTATIEFQPLIDPYDKG